MPQRLLYLLGGDIAVFELIADEYLAAAGGQDAGIAILLEGGRGWERHLPSYVEPWRRRGVERLHIIVPDQTGRLDTDATLRRLREATGIVVGGGPTPNYQRLYAAEPLRTVIRERYHSGVPYAGLSAGALLAPEVCARRGRDPDEPALQVMPGLGLVNGLLVGVHFDQPDSLEHLLEAMSRTQTLRALGIDEGACVVLEDEVPVRVLGRSAYEVTMAGPNGTDHHIRELQSCPAP